MLLKQDGGHLGANLQMKRLRQLRLLTDSLEFHTSSREVLTPKCGKFKGRPDKTLLLPPAPNPSPPHTLFYDPLPTFSLLPDNRDQLTLSQASKNDLSSLSDF